MGWVTQETSGTFLICQRTPVRFGLSVETRFPFLVKGLLARQIWQGMRRSPQNLHGFLTAFEIKKGKDHLSPRAGEQLNYPLHLGSAKVRLCELVRKAQMRILWLQFGAIKAEVIGC